MTIGIVCGLLTLKHVGSPSLLELNSTVVSESSARYWEAATTFSLGNIGPSRAWAVLSGTAQYGRQDDFFREPDWPTLEAMLS